MRLIDADKLLKVIAEQERWNVSDFVYESIKKAPTIEAEPTRHGKWIRILDTRFGEKLNDIIGCSVCNIYYSSMDLIRRNYCPNCGARMDANKYEELEINPCRGCEDYDGKGSCLSNGGCANVNEVKDEL